MAKEKKPAAKKKPSSKTGKSQTSAGKPTNYYGPMQAPISATGLAQLASPLATMQRPAEVRGAAPVMPTVAIPQPGIRGVSQGPGMPNTAGMTAEIPLPPSQQFDQSGVAIGFGAAPAISTQAMPGYANPGMMPRMPIGPVSNTDPTAPANGPIWRQSPGGPGVSGVNVPGPYMAPGSVTVGPDPSFRPDNKPLVGGIGPEGSYLGRSGLLQPPMKPLFSEGKPVYNMPVSVPEITRIPHDSSPRMSQADRMDSGLEGARTSRPGWTPGSSARLDRRVKEIQAGFGADRARADIASRAEYHPAQVKDGLRATLPMDDQANIAQAQAQYDAAYRSGDPKQIQAAKDALGQSRLDASQVRTHGFGAGLPRGTVTAQEQAMRQPTDPGASWAMAGRFGGQTAQGIRDARSAKKAAGDAAHLDFMKRAPKDQAASYKIINDRRVAAGLPPLPVPQPIYDPRFPHAPPQLAGADMANRAKYEVAQRNHNRGRMIQTSNMARKYLIPADAASQFVAPQAPAYNPQLFAGRF